MMKTKIVVAGLLGIIVLGSTLPTASADSAPVYTGYFSSYAVGGYDSVAYFENSKAVKGDKRYRFDYKGATWLFDSENHRDLFKANPEKYAPQYGGYCAYAVARNDLVSADPEAWRIVDGKLFLNYDKDIQKKWESDRNAYISKADKNWPSILK